MPNITDFLLGTTAGVTAPVVGVWVRLTNNATAAAFVSSSATDSLGTFTVLAVPAGSYTVATGPTVGGPFTNTTDANYFIGADVNAAVTNFRGNVSMQGLDPWYDVTSPAYAGGAKHDGVTDDAPAIAAAISAASAANGGMVFMPAAGSGNPYLINSQILVPTSVKLIGGGRNSCWVKAGASFPVNTAMVRLGVGGAGAAVDCCVSDMRLDCNSVTGSIGVYSETINENCRIERMSIVNYMSRGIQIKQPGSGALAQHYSIEEIELFTGSSTPNTAIAVDIANTSLGTFFRFIRRITSSGSGALTTAIKIDGAMGSVENIHVENATNGILIGSVLGVIGLDVHSVDGLNTTTNLVVISNATTSRSIAISNVIPNGSTNTIVDQINSNTFTSDVGLYVVGINTWFASDGATASQLGRTQLFRDLRFRVGFPSFVASYTPDLTQQNMITMFLTGNVTVNNPTGLATGAFITFKWLQDGTGGRTITYGANYHTGGAVAIATTLNTSTLDTFYSYDGSVLNLISRVTGQA